MITLLEPQDYQEKVHALFNRAKQDLEKIISDARIEHIGASAIDGAISKGDLDIFLGVEKADFEKTVSLLTSDIYTIKQDTLRTSSLCMLITDAYDYDVAVQVVENGSKFEDFINFRDLLRENPQLLQDYNTIKKQSAHMNMDDYREAKNKFISDVLSNADK